MMMAEDLEEESAAIAEEYRLRNNEAEMNQRQANKQCFDLTKSVLLNAPFTISEFKELTGIINKRRGSLERAAEWTKQVQTRTQGQDQFSPPSLPDITLQMIFSFLPTTEDILSCRLVSHDWMSAASKELRKRVCKSLYFYKPPRPGREDLQEFLETMDKSQLLPLNSFRLKIKSLKEEEHFALLENFFQMFGPILQNLFLDFSRFKYQGGSMEPPRLWIPKEINFDNLLNLRFNSWSTRRDENLEPHYWDEETRSKFASAYFASAKNLQKLTFESDTLAELVTCLENSPLLHLKTLFLRIPQLRDKELKNLGRIVNLKSLSLKSYHIRFESKSESMKGFLQSQSKTLEYLKLLGYYVRDTDFVYEFPRMEKLKVLDIQNSGSRRDNIPLGLRFARIDWTACFPELKEFQMCDMEEDCRDTLFPPDTESVHLGLKTIVFPLRFQRTLLDSLPVIGRMFPNVQTVKICVEDLLRPILSNWFPNLQRIVVRFDVQEFVNEMAEDGDDDVTRVEKFLKFYAWQLTLSPEIKDYVERKSLSEFAFEIKSGQGMDEMEAEPEKVRRTYDSTWFLRLVRQRISLEEINKELLVRRKGKKIVADSSDESETSDEDLCSNSDLSDGDMVDLEGSDDASWEDIA